MKRIRLTKLQKESLKNEIIRLYSTTELSRQEIANLLNIKLSKVKSYLSEARIIRPAEIKTKIAYREKLKKKPNAMSEMRAAITERSISKQIESIKKTYQNSKLREIISAQRKKWWKLLSPTDKKAFLDKRLKAFQKSEKVQQHLESLKGKKGAKNPKTIVQLITNGVSNSDELMHKYASKYNGYFKGGYIDSAHKCLWECSKGHTFTSRPNNIQQGNWCPYCSHLISTPTQEIANFIKTLGEEVEFEHKIDSSSNMKLDIFIPKANLGIEFNGLYWHSSASPSYVPNAHYKKFLLCQKNKINLFAIFEDEWENKRPLIEEMIKIRINKFNGIILNARDLELKWKINNFESFFEQNHLDGNVPAFAAGLFYKDELVGCGSFRRFGEVYELVRFATKMGFRIRGSLGKLISIVPKPIFSYSNNRLSNGNVYRVLGFQYKGIVRPSYWYTDFNQRLFRTKCKRINEPEILSKYPTEKEQALAGLFSRKYLGHDKPLFKIEGYGSLRWMLYK